MAKLVNCKECDHDVAKKAKTCPNCGIRKPGVKGMSIGKLFLVSIVGLFVIIPIFGSIGLNAPPRTPPTAEQQAAAAISRLSSQRESWARIFAEEKVRDQLISPASAKFSGYSETVSGPIRDAENRWVVRGWVDSQNGFGALLRSDYEVVLEFNEGSHASGHVVSVKL